uniref:Uncharacterized protein n=1 Tax=Rhodopseudomonas palustris (strain BisA53) TaxID=316055 RepID=Q07NT3_RHOP5
MILRGWPPWAAHARQGLTLGGKRMEDTKVVPVLVQALMRRAFTDLAAEFGVADTRAAERAVRLCQTLLSGQLSRIRDEPIHGVVLSEEMLASVSATLHEMTEAALEQIERERTSRHGTG